MNKQLFIIFIFLALPCALCSQLRIGIHAAGTYSFTNLHDEKFHSFAGAVAVYDKNGTLSGIPAYNAGLVFDIAIAKEISLETRLSVSNKGWQEKVTVTDDSTGVYGTNPYSPHVTAQDVVYRETFRLYYLNIPVLLKFNIPVKKIKVVIGAGGYFDYGFLGRYKIEVIRETVSDIKDVGGKISFDGKPTDAFYNANKINFGIQLKAGLEWRSGIGIEFFYTTGIKDVLTNRFNILSYRSQNTGIGFYYFLPKKIFHKHA